MWRKVALAVVQVAPERKGGDEGRGRGRWASRSRVDLRKPERPAELPERPLPWPLLALSLARPLHLYLPILSERPAQPAQPLPLLFGRKNIRL